MRFNISFLPTALLISVCIALTAGVASAESYTTYNLWFENPKKLYSINYQVGSILPAGTKVTDVAVKSGRRSYVRFKAEGQEYTIYFQAKFHPGKTVEDIRNRLLSDKPLEDQIAKFTELEQRCIRNAEVKPGISKEAVLHVFGYPPEHQTPMLSRNTWMYWRNRFGRRAVDFDDNGKVASVR